MMSNYENETCESCKYYCMGHRCRFKGGYEDELVDIDWRCDDFVPSVELRKVLALEAIAATLRVTGDGQFVRSDKAKPQ